MAHHTSTKVVRVEVAREPTARARSEMPRDYMSVEDPSASSPFRLARCINPTEIQPTKLPDIRTPAQ